MTLSDFERHSALWIKINKYLLERVETLRSKNDGDLDQFETARLRGRIAELKGLIALGDPSPITSADEQI